MIKLCFKLLIALISFLSLQNYMGKLKTIIDIKKDGESLYFKVDKGNVKSFYASFNLMNKQIEAGKPVHKRTFNKFINSLVSVSNEFALIYNDTVDTITNKALERFKNEKEYNFTYRKLDDADDIPTAEPSVSYLKYSLADMIKKTVEKVYSKSCFLQDIENVTVDKFLCIDLCYQYIVSYRSNLNKPHQKFLSDYKSIIIAGYITECMGYSLSSKKNLRFSEIYEASKYAILKYKNKSIKEYL